MMMFTLAGTVQSVSQQSGFRLAPIFTDNMVIQQNRNVPLWGKGSPGTEIIIRTSWGKAASALVRQDGKWSSEIRTPKAGGPYQISIKHEGGTFVLRNILAGEVWICSGQSNMEMPVEGWPPSDTIKNSRLEIENALYPEIRLYTVKRAIEAEPSDECVGSWNECSPLDIGSFSATAYFFGKKLYNTLKVPIGLIHTSWGGTPIEAWMSKEALGQFPEFADQLKKLEQSRENLSLLKEWITGHPSVNINERGRQHKWEGLNFGDDNCSSAEYNDSAWQEMVLPANWEEAGLGQFDGTVWFRKQVVIPAAWIGKDLILKLGPIDDMDETYVNGRKVGSYLGEGFWKVNRVYKIPSSTVNDTLLKIAVRVIDIQGGGGLWGNGNSMTLSREGVAAEISLDGSWKYMPVAEYIAGTFYIYGAKGNEFYNRPKLPIDFSENTPTSLFNGMVNPLVPFNIRGVIWYQGESNTGNPELYKRLFPAMIKDWRKVFSCGDFPFDFVQIAPWNYGPGTESQLLREAQMQTLSVKNTGMAVTLDIGNPNNIHPADKESVGDRLALWALAKTYGKKIVYSGPIYKSMRKMKGRIVVSFDYAGKGLMIRERQGENNFTIAGNDRVFKKAKVKISGKILVISNPDVPEPVAVRYNWSNTEEGTLFNKEGLPASSFRTDAW